MKAYMTGPRARGRQGRCSNVPAWAAVAAAAAAVGAFCDAFGNKCLPTNMFIIFFNGFTDELMLPIWQWTYMYDRCFIKMMLRITHTLD